MKLFSSLCISVVYNDKIPLAGPFGGGYRDVLGHISSECIYLCTVYRSYQDGIPRVIYKTSKMYAEDIYADGKATNK